MSDQISAIAALLQTRLDDNGQPLVTTETIATLIVNGYKNRDLLLCLDLDKDLPQIDGIDMGQKSAVRTILRGWQTSHRKLTIAPAMHLTAPLLPAITAGHSLPQYLTVPTLEHIEEPLVRQSLVTSKSPVMHTEVSTSSANPHITIPAIKSEPSFDANISQAFVPSMSSSFASNSQPSTSWASDDSNLSYNSTRGQSGGRKVRKRKFVLTRKIIKVDKERSNRKVATKTMCDIGVDTRYIVRPKAELMPTQASGLSEETNRTQGRQSTTSIVVSTDGN